VKLAEESKSCQNCKFYSPFETIEFYTVGRCTKTPPSVMINPGRTPSFNNCEFFAKKKAVKEGKAK
jgi:hypothetical protein